MHGGLGRRGCEKGDQDIHGEDDDAYGCCGQALTRFTSHLPEGPGRPFHTLTDQHLSRTMGVDQNVIGFPFPSATNA